MKTKWKFLREGLKSENGTCKWEIGKWKKHKGKLELCESGFHCSDKIYEAFSYVQGEILAKVEVVGKHLDDNNKSVWQEMRVIKTWKWQKKDSVALSIYAAELVLSNFEKQFPDDDRPRKALESAKEWLKNQTKKNESAAGSAAWSAAGSAAESVGSVESAAWYALLEKINKWMNKRLKELEAYEV